MPGEAIRSEAHLRAVRMLRTAMGDAIANWLVDPAVVEVMLNPDGRLWIDRLGDGISDSGKLLSPADGERIIRLVAHHVGAEIHGRSPRVSAELPETGERFEGLLPRSLPHQLLQFASPRSRCSRSTTMSPTASCRGTKPASCARR